MIFKFMNYDYMCILEDNWPFLGDSNTPNQTVAFLTCPQAENSVSLYFSKHK